MCMSVRDKQITTAERLKIPLEKMPRSLAIIMDGIGRWAQARSLSRAEGHVEGAKTAEKIVQYREQHGAFQKPEDIKLVQGVGEKTWELNKEIICVEEPQKTSAKK